MKNKNYFITTIILLVLLLIAAITSCLIGRYHISSENLFEIIKSKILLGKNITSTDSKIIFDIRVPRIAVAILIGGSLSAAGSVYQGVFKNPMVSPDILGASSGAGFGAALAINLSLSGSLIQIYALVFGIIAVLMSFTVAKIISKSKDSTLSLVLTGMVIGSLFTAFISIVKFVADAEDKLPQITFWLMGGLSTVNRKDLYTLLIPFIIGFIPLFLVRWKINIISLGDEEARALGVETGHIRIISIICSTLLTASAVSIGGMIGWIGLIIPHLARLLVGSNYKIFLPVSTILGGIFLLIVDDIARSLFSVEIPIGILSSIVGAPFFLYLMISNESKGPRYIIKNIIKNLKL
jgi:iron complex transport system permease protein